MLSFHILIMRRNFNGEDAGVVRFELRDGGRLLTCRCRWRLDFRFRYYRLRLRSDDDFRRVVVVAQCEQSMRNVASALAQAGAAIADIVRVRYIVPRREDFEPCWPVLKRYLGDVRPASTMMQAELFDPRMKIEIEVTARRRTA